VDEARRHGADWGRLQGMAQLTPPLPAASSLRLAVWHLRRDEVRRRFPPRLHVGVPGGQEVAFEDVAADRLDAALRVEIAAALLSRALELTETPAAWLTREGELSSHDADLAWLAAVGAAAGEAGVLVPLVVVTRRGWYDPRTLARKEWKRLRVTPAAGATTPGPVSTSSAASPP